jgi:hypothetical protein
MLNAYTASRKTNLSAAWRQINIEDYHYYYYYYCCSTAVLGRDTAGRTPWTGDQPVARPLPTQRTTETQNMRTQTSMP